MLTSTYLGRYALWFKATNSDHLRFPTVPVNPAATPRRLERRQSPVVFDPVTVRGQDGERKVPLDALVNDTGSTALLVLRDGEVLYERYANGGAVDRLNRCFSVTKSIGSALVGAAIRHGHIDDIDQTVGEFLPELRGERRGELTLRQLLEMQSGIRFREGVLPWQDDARTYYDPDCRRLTLGARIVDPVGEFFHYNNFCTFLIGMIVERATGETVDRFLERAIWQPIGAEHPASFLIDSGANRFVHLESGFNATAADLARFGLLYLEDGKVGGEQVLPPGWVDLSTTPEGRRTDQDYFRHYRKLPWGRPLSSGRYFYGLFWWGYLAGEAEHDYFAMGVLGEHIYVSPRHRTVIVRLSERFPPGMWWPPVFRQLAEQASMRA
ncbi:MAG TPA: serine hydrolase [Devosiaceae bacterium]